MDVWFLLLYAGATFLALRSLAALMTQHRTHYRQQFMREHQRKAAQEAAQKEAEVEETSDAAA